jgi:hypothetical protein
VAVIQKRFVLPNPKDPTFFSKPPAFIAKPGGRYNHSPAFHIVVLAFIKFISAILNSSRSVNPAGRIPFRPADLSEADSIPDSA